MSRAASRLMAALVVMVPVALYAQHAHFAAAGQNAGKTTPAPKKSEAAPAKSTMTDAQKIASAESAAPSAISSKATVMDWAETENSKPRQLRAGTNGWVCYPSTPQNTGGEDPMCLDKGWQAWGEAFMNKKPQPPAGTAGIAYMLKGDKGTSNTDPNAAGPTATNQWVVSPAHIMVMYADPKMLDAYPTDPKNGGPWVMWKGSPYAHIMVPVSPTKGASMTAATAPKK